MDAFALQLQEAIVNGTYTVIESQNQAYSVGSTYTEIGDDLSTTDVTDPDLQVKLRNTKLLFASPYAFTLTEMSTDADLLGFDLSQGALSPSPFIHVYAPASGSEVIIGDPVTATSPLAVGLSIIAHSGIELNSGPAEVISVEALASLATIGGSITIEGDSDVEINGGLSAAGEGSDLYVSAAETLTIRGDLTAADQIVLSAQSIETPDNLATLTVTEETGDIIFAAVEDIRFQVYRISKAMA